MNKLSKFIIQSFFWPFLLTFCIAIFVLLMQFLWVYIDDIIGKGLPWYVIAELLIYTTANLIPLAVPLAVLLASIMTFGNIGEHFELTALKSSGVSILRIIRPLFISIVIFSIGVLFFNNYIIPKANLRYYSLLFDIRSQKPGINIKPNVFYKEITDVTIRIDEKVLRKNKPDLLKGILIYNHSNSFGNKKLTIADSGVFKLSKNKKYLILTLHNGIDYQENNNRINQITYTKSRFKEYSLTINLKGFNLERSAEDAFKNDVKMFSMHQMKNQISIITQQKIETVETIIKQIKDDYFFSDRLDSKQKKSLESIKKSLSINKKITLINAALNHIRSVKERFDFNRSFLEVLDTKVLIFKINYHKKMTLPLAIIAMFLIGAPLGAIVKKGGLGLPIVISIICFIIYWSISITAEKTASQGVISPFLGAWTSIFVMIPVGLFLLYRASKV